MNEKITKYQLDDLINHRLEMLARDLVVNTGYELEFIKARLATIEAKCVLWNQEKVKYKLIIDDYKDGLISEDDLMEAW
jgi:hypothetical protein